MVPAQPDVSNISTAALRTSSHVWAACIDRRVEFPPAVHSGGGVAWRVGDFPIAGSTAAREFGFRELFEFMLAL